MSISLQTIAPIAADFGDEASPADSQQERPPSPGLVRAFFFCIARLAFAAFLMLTSVYCLLVWVPFSYFGFIRNPLLPWIPVFVRFHALIFGVLLAAVAVTLLPDLRRNESRRAAFGFLAINGCFLIYLWRQNALASLQPDLTSYIWSMLSLFPLIWLAALDLSGMATWPPVERQAPADLNKTTIAAVTVSVVFATTSFLRSLVEGNGGTAATSLAGIGASLCFHLVIFTSVGLILVFFRWVSARTPWPGRLSFVLTRILAWFLCVQALRTIILPTISFEGISATIFAAVVSLVVILFATGFAAKLRVMFPPQMLSAARAVVPTWLWGIAALAVLGAAAYGIPVLLGRTDWDFVLQRVAVIAVWIVALQLVGWIGIRLRGRAASIAIFFVLAVAVTGFARYARLTLYNPSPSASLQGALDAYAGADVSFKTAYDVLSHPVDNKAYRQFYEFLKQNTNLGRNVSVGPADTRLVSDLQPTPGTKPNIFLFVIDSLRQDYVSPYNPAVDYTPEIGRFAKDSVVLQNAFTRYGGTALSEPAIWVGAMQLHKQYIDPFYPMNNLQKLLETDGYQSYISVDPLLRFMLEPSSSITELDHDTKSWSDLDFIPTLKELEHKLDSRPDKAKPIFAYTQPQNVHTLTLERSKIPGGRKAVSISELRRMDAAFGEFVAFLQQRGLYDNSIIILTADHGDSYGEFGRYGHSDFLFPEIIRIPLIVHLPPRLRDQFVWDAQQPAFTTDITPSLYYLLGHGPTINSEIFGRPLFTHTLQEQSPYLRPHYLIVSSYAPVYAILGGTAKSLFIVDAVHSKNYYYNLSEDPLGSRNHVTVPLENENEVLIRHDVGMIDDFYHWNAAEPSK